MAGTITTDQVTIEDAEVVADYLVLGTFASAQALNDDIKVQGTNAINGRVSANTAWSLATTGVALDLTVTNRHVWMWIRLITWPSADTKANGGIGISISSDTAPTLTGVSPSNGPTNSKTWYLGGSDTDTTTGWVCYCVDPNGTPDLTIGTPVMSSVDRVGVRCKVTGTVSNKTLNLHHDVLRYGTGLTIIDGTGQTAAAFADIATADALNANAWGIVTQLAGIYFIAGRLNFGTTSQVAETVFTDTDKVIVWQNFPVAATFYLIKIDGASGQVTTFTLGNYNPITELTSNGCTIKGAGNPASTTHAIWTLTSSNANQVTRFYGSNFSELDSAALSYNTFAPTVATCTTVASLATVTTISNFNTSGVVKGMAVTGTGIGANTYVQSVDSNTQITLTTVASGSGVNTLTFTYSNEIRKCTFQNFADITTNGCLIDDCIFQDVKTTAPISGTNAIIINSTTEMSRITNCTFINCNRAIRITVAGTYTFDNIRFTGNSFDIENTSVGAVIINATNGSNPATSVNTAGGSVTINNAVTLAITVVDASNIPIQNARVAILTDDTSETELMNELTNASGIATESYAYTSDKAIILRIRSSSGATAYIPLETTGTITAAGFSFQAQMVVDPLVIVD